jgi:hypothetical protein
MKKFFYTLVDRIVAVLGAFIFCQLPAFMQQYMGLLLGHLEECKRWNSLNMQNAALSNKTVSEYIQKFLSQQDPDFVQQGHFLQGIEERSNELASAYAHLQNAPVWKKPFVFIAEADSTILKEAYSHFTPSLSFSIETLLYGLAGLFIAVILLRFITWAIMLPFRSVKKA